MELWILVILKKIQKWDEILIIKLSYITMFVWYVFNSWLSDGLNYCFNKQMHYTYHQNFNINPLFTRLSMIIGTKQGKDRTLDLGYFEKPTKMGSNSND